MYYFHRARHPLSCPRYRAPVVPLFLSFKGRGARGLQILYKVRGNAELGKIGTLIPH